MAQIEQGGGDDKKKKGAQKKMHIHVDFTPMVDMNMLLITFFMLCTTMLKSQTLNIILPTNEKVDKENQNKAKQSEAFTIIVDSERADAVDGVPGGYRCRQRNQGKQFERTGNRKRYSQRRCG